MLRELIHFQGRQLYQNCFLYFLKRGLLKKEIDRKYCPFRVDPFQKGLGGQESKQEVSNDDSLVEMA